MIKSTNLGRGDRWIGGYRKKRPKTRISNLSGHSEVGLLHSPSFIISVFLFYESVRSCWPFVLVDYKLVLS